MAKHPRQLHFEPDVIVGDIDRSVGGLAEQARAEIEVISLPLVFEHGECPAEARTHAEAGLRRRVASSLPSLWGMVTTTGSDILAKPLLEKRRWRYP